MIDNVKPFIKHNALSKDFTVQTDSHDYVGVHTVTITSAIFVYDDYTMASGKEFAT